MNQENFTEQDAAEYLIEAHSSLFEALMPLWGESRLDNDLKIDLFSESAALLNQFRSESSNKVLDYAQLDSCYTRLFEIKEQLTHAI